MPKLVQKLEEIPPEYANRFAYVIFLWLIPGIFSVFAGFFAKWILSDRMQSPQWLEIALNFEGIMPILYVVFGIWAYAFSSSPKGSKRGSSGLNKRLVLLWIIPGFLLASQIIITIISWDV